MTPLRQRFTQDLQLRNYAPRTVSTYVAAVARFARHFHRSPELLGPEHVREYQLHLLRQKASWSRFNQAACALRFLYRVTLRRKDVVEMVPYGKKTRSLPAVLSTDEVARLFAAVSNPRDLMILQTAYAAGLRVSEVVRLQVGDVDPSRMTLHVRGAKGRKDRFVPLSPVLLGLLRRYWREHRPRTWLFPGGKPGGHLSAASVQRPCQRAVRASGISKKASTHTLRHGYATHLLEHGTDLATLQRPAVPSAPVPSEPVARQSRRPVGAVPGPIRASRRRSGGLELQPRAASDRVSHLQWHGTRRHRKEGHGHVSVR
jgi:site-specific recombinase XerD